MKATVDQLGCIGCGLCAGTCPDVFHMNGEGKAEGAEIPAGMESCAQEARDNCPVSVIDIQE
ncbi:MAG: ferredoxin [Oscillospiraceae bacterium]|nr:ferredoxin [Oscillospiraceae bacterium]